MQDKTADAWQRVVNGHRLDLNRVNAKSLRIINDVKWPVNVFAVLFVFGPALATVLVVIDLE